MKRFNLEAINKTVLCIEDENGDWVLWDDIKELTPLDKKTVTNDRK